MEQKREYLDFIELNPSSLHNTPVQEGCSAGGERGAEGRAVYVKCDKIKVNPLRERRFSLLVSPRVKELTLIVAGVTGSIALMGWILVQLALWVRDMAIAFWSWLVATDFFFYLAVGLSVAALLYLAFWMNGQVKSAKPFTDYEQTKTPAKKNGQVVINNHYHINQ